MSLNSPLLSRIIAAAVNISQNSAKILRDIKSSGEMNIQEKEKNDYVTKADFLSQLNIIKSLQHSFPKLQFCGEEGDLKDAYDDIVTSQNEDVLTKSNDLPLDLQSIKEEDLLVWVDPLDGTREYTQGYEDARFVTILIGVAWRGKPIAGVINQPFFKKDADSYLERILWGIVGLGAFDLKNGKMTVPVRPKDAKITVVTTRSHMTDLIKKSLEAIPNSKLTHAGGAGYKVLSVIDGESDCYIYPRNGTKRWDTCAPEALIRCLNGSLTDIYNNDYLYVQDENTHVENYNGIVASLSQNNSFYVDCLSDELKAQVKKDADEFIASKISKL